MAKRRRSQAGQRGQKGQKPKRPRGRATRRRALRLERTIVAAFCLSGFAGLMHQVVWAKLLVGLIGATAHAQAIVLAVFMGGLALGSVVFGRRVDRLGRPLRTYVVLELLIGGYCLLLPLLVWVMGSGYVAMAGLFFESAELKLILRLSLAISTVLFPAVLMGGTLPLLARRLIGQVDETQTRVAGLYAINSFGAVLGAGTAGFVTLPLLGVYPSLAIASFLNFGAAALVLGPARAEDRVEPPSAATLPEHGLAPAPAPAYRSHQYAAALVALALSGFAAMGYEVLFTRVIALAFGLSTYSFTVMLMCFITGIGLGSAIASRLRIERPLWILGVTQLVVVVAFLAVTPLISRLPYLIALLRIDLHGARFGFELYQLGKAALCLAVLLLPATCLGFGFPLVARIQTRSADQIGFRVGSTYAWNTVGNVLGAVGTSLVLLPALGLLGAFHFELAMNFAAGTLILLVASEVPAARRIAAVALAVGVATLQILAGIGWIEPVTFARSHLELWEGPGAGDDDDTRARHPASSFQAWKQRYMLPVETAQRFYFEEDAHTSVMAYDNGHQVVLYVNGKPDASTYRDLNTQLLLGHIPLFLVPDARDVLVIGYGSGITTGSVLRHPVERVDVVEISTGVIGAHEIFSEANYNALEDPRTHVYMDDGQSFVRAVPHRYDVIISEPSNPWIAGIAGLFTVEFFENVRDRLNPGGVGAVWFHQYEQSDASVDLVLRSLNSVFPHVLVFRSPDFSDIIATASMDPLEPDFNEIELRFDEPAVRNDLARMGVTNLATLLSHHAISAERLPELLPPGPLNTARHQRLEYQAPRSFFEGVNSDFLQRNDPLLRGTGSSSDILLDRYVAYRASEGEPVRRSEFADAARLYKHALDKAFVARARAAPESEGVATRAARGRVVDPGEMGFYEAVYRAALYTGQGRRDDALPFQQRALALRTGAGP